MIETFKGTVYPWQCDNFGHMNVQFYVARFDEANWHLLADCGITPDYFRENNKAIVAVEQNISYHKELFSGDLILVRSKLMEISDKTMIYYHQMINCQTNEVASEMKLTAVHIDTRTRKAVPFSNEMMNHLIRKVVE